MQFGRHLGRRPRQLVTTTPRPIVFGNRLIADPQIVLTFAARGELRVRAL